MKKIMLLGSGELGKEVVIAAKRLGHYVIAVDSYDDAPAQQVADTREVINMLDANQLDAIVAKHKPDIIVPEIEAIRTECFYEYEKQGIQVTPSAKAVNYTMNRKAIRNLAAFDLGLKTAKFEYATTLEGFQKAVANIGIPCVVKPLMSSSGKGQSIIKTESDIEKAWNYGMEAKRGDIAEMIVEEFIKFESEITLLTVTQKNGNTLFCAPIGHRQERGDYQESWQPHQMNADILEKAKVMAKKVTEALGGYGIWGIEFFLTKDDVYFSELSPRPHDTGMVTLAGTQNFNEFELHVRAFLGLPINEIQLLHAGASAVVLADRNAENFSFSGLDNALVKQNADVKIFGKPVTKPYRRMAVGLTYDANTTEISKLVTRAKEIAACVKINYN